MRRFVLLGCATLIFTSCAERSVLPFADVMERAARVSATLTSARFALTADLKSSAASGIAEAHVVTRGVTQDQGSVVQATVQASGKLQAENPHTFIVDADVITDRRAGTYLLLRSIQVNPPHPVLPTEILAAFAGQWWSFPANTTSVPSIAPDPSLLAAQAQVVTVVEDKGIQRLNGHRAYRYSIAVDKEKLVDYLRQSSMQNGSTFVEADVRKEIDRYTATGELWIDAEAFDVLKVQWNIQPIAGEANKDAMHVVLTMDLSDHNKAPPIAIPTDARQVPGGLPIGPWSGASASAAPAGTPGDDASVLDLLRMQQQSGNSSALPPDLFRSLGQ